MSGESEPIHATGPFRTFAPVHRRLSRLFLRFGFSPPGRWLYLTALFVLADVVVLSWVQYQGFLAFDTFAQDLGVYNQAFYTTVHDHRFFYYTANIPSGSGGSLFAVHFVPFMFLLLPIAAVAPGAGTLLVVKVAALALGAFPVFGLAARQLKSEVWGFAFAGVYLLSPITMTLDWISFDPEVFLPFTFLGAFYFLYRRRTLPFLVFWMLGLAVIESAAPLLAAFAFLALLGSFVGPKLVGVAEVHRERVLIFGALAIAVLWFALAYFVITQLSPVGAIFGEAYARHFEVLGATSIPGVVPQVLARPDLAAAALSFQGSSKLVYLGLLFGSLGFLPIFGPLRYSLPVGGWLVLALLSDTPSYYSFSSQYLGYVSPFLFGGAIGGYLTVRSALDRWGRPNVELAREPTVMERTVRWHAVTPRRAFLPAVLGLAVLISVGIANPLLPNPVSSLTFVTYGVPQQNAHAQLLHRLVGMIPGDAGVFTTPRLFPQVSDRPNAFVLPTAEFFAGNATYWGSLNGFINQSRFVLLDYTIDQYPALIVQFFADLSAFGTLAASDGAFLYERGWHGSPVLATPSSSTYPGSALALNPTEVVDGKAGPYGRAIFYASGPRIAGHPGIWGGPGIRAPIPGVYQMTIYYQLTAIVAGPAFSFRATQTDLNVNATPDLNTSLGHHYEYTFQKSSVADTASQTLVNATAGNLNRQVDGSATLLVTENEVGFLSSGGNCLAPNLSLYVLGMVVTWLGPLPPPP